MQNHVLERQAIRELLRKLRQEERKLLFFRYGREKRQREMGVILGASQAKLSRLEKEVLARLRCIFLEK